MGLHLNRIAALFASGWIPRPSSQRASRLPCLAGEFVRCDGQQVLDRWIGSGYARREPHRSAVQRRFRGKLLYGSLYKYGFASSADPLNEAGDANPELKLQNCRITNAVRCLPPQNKPEPAEIRSCNGYVAEELASAAQRWAILALGTIAHQAVLMALQLRKSEFAFGHGARHALPAG